MKVAVVQMASGPDKKKNIARALELVTCAIQHKSEYIVLPEYFNFRGRLRSLTDFQAISEDIPGESSLSFFELARRKKVYILLGSLYEKIKGSPKAYNTAVLINDKGQVSGSYRKINLFEANINNMAIREGKIFCPGKKLVVTKMRGFKVGLSMCFDVRFADLYLQYKKQKADLLCIPSSFSETTGQAHWEVLTRARAIENLAYVLAPNQAGVDGRGVRSYGHSLIVDPWGKILARGSADKEEILYADISQDVIEEKRHRLPTVCRSRRGKGVLK